MKNAFLISLMFLSYFSFGQQSKKNIVSNKFCYKNSVEFELFGHGSFYSIDYERLIVNNEKTKTLGQIGFAYYPESTGVIPLWIPISINQLISFHSNHLELGIGQIIINDEMPDGKDDYKLFGSLKIGYRYQKPNGRFLIKAAFTPIIDYWDKIDENIHGEKLVDFISWGGITFGYNF